VELADRSNLSEEDLSFSKRWRDFTGISRKAFNPVVWKERALCLPLDLAEYDAK
jgi:hypothetical protein